MTLQHRAHGLMGLLLLGGGILYSFPPQASNFYPLCPLYATTHLLCPGCGGTRALYQLLHFHLGQAIHLNALITVCAPMVLAGFLFWYYSVLKYHRSPAVRLARSVVIGLYVVVVMFVIVRNIVLNTGTGLTI